MARGRHARRDLRGPTTVAFGIAVLLVAGWGGNGNASPPAAGDAQVPALPADVSLPPVLRQPLGAGSHASPRALRAALQLAQVAPRTGLPRVAHLAYLRAAAREAALRPSCHLPWPLLAGIGFIESGHAHGHGSELPHWNGIARPAILGPVLNGVGFAAIPDSDAGRLDGDRAWDRAVGPMQFLPSTWRSWGVDADGDHVANPEDIYDATAAAGDYLCAAGGDLSRADGVTTAVFAYNHSTDYVRAVVTAAQYYGGATPATMTALATLPEAAPVPEAAPTNAQPAPSPVPRQQPTRIPTPSPATSPSPGPWPSPSVTPSVTASDSQPTSDPTIAVSPSSESP